ncbi:efflux RND transporter periplasmic adaptor subunit, partial [Shewanella sp. 0m-11]
METLNKNRIILTLLIATLLSACGAEEQAKEEEKYAVPVETATVIQGDVSSFY